MHNTRLLLADVVLETIMLQVGYVSKLPELFVAV